MSTLIGLVAAIAFVISGAPLAWTVFRTPKLKGFSHTGWAALFVAVTAILLQLIFSHAGIIIIAAQVFNTAVVGFVVVQVFRKG